MKKQNKKPPAIFRWFLGLVADQGISHSMLGDFEEDYKDIFIEQGRWKAYLWCTLQVIMSLFFFF